MICRPYCTEWVYKMNKHILGVFVFLFFAGVVSGDETDIEVELKIDKERYMEYVKRERRINEIHGQRQTDSQSVTALWIGLMEAQKQDNDEEVKRKIQDLSVQIENVMIYLHEEDSKLEENRMLAMNLLGSEKKQYKPVPLVLNDETAPIAAHIYDNMSEEDQGVLGPVIASAKRAEDNTEKWRQLYQQLRRVKPTSLDTESGLNYAITLSVMRRQKIATQKIEYEYQKEALASIVEEYTRREVFMDEAPENQEKALEAAGQFMEALQAEDERSIPKGNPFK